MAKFKLSLRIYFTSRAQQIYFVDIPRQTDSWEERTSATSAIRLRWSPTRPPWPNISQLRSSQIVKCLVGTLRFLLLYFAFLQETASSIHYFRVFPLYWFWILCNTIKEGRNTSWEMRAWFFVDNYIFWAKAIQTKREDFLLFLTLPSPPFFQTQQQKLSSNSNRTQVRGLREDLAVAAVTRSITSAWCPAQTKAKSKQHVRRRRKALYYYVRKQHKFKHT